MPLTVRGGLRTGCHILGLQMVEMDVDSPLESFPAYCRRDRSALLELAARLSGSAADGEDLVHDVLERFARRWPEVAALDNVDAYARRALINLSRNRHKRRQAEQAALARLAAAAQNPTQPFEPADASIWSRVRALPGRQPAVVALAALEARSHAEVGAILGISAANARQISSRARRTLRAQLGEWVQVEG